MADKREREGRSAEATAVSFDDLLQHIESLVDGSRERQVDDADELLSSLRRWWCRHYKRPYKDPLLDCYSIEELWYEYLDVTYDERKVKREEAAKAAAAAPTEDDYKWAEEMENEDDEELPELENEASNHVPADSESAEESSPHPDTIEDGEEFSTSFS